MQPLDGFYQKHQDFAGKCSKRARESLRDSCQAGAAAAGVQRRVCIKLLCSDATCEQYLSCNGENKVVDAAQLKVEVKLSPQRQISILGAAQNLARCISIIPGDNCPGAVEAVKRAVEHIVRNQWPTDSCKVQMLLAPEQVEAICRGGMFELEALGATAKLLDNTDAMYNHLAHSWEQLIEISASPGIIRDAAGVCAQHAWRCSWWMLPLPLPASPSVAYNMMAYAQTEMAQAPLASEFSAPTPSLQLPVVLSQQVPLQYRLVNLGDSPQRLMHGAQRPYTPVPLQPHWAVETKFRLVVSQAQAKHLMELVGPSAGRRVCRLQELRDEAGAACHLQLHDNKHGCKKLLLRCLEITSTSSSVPIVNKALQYLERVMQILIMNSAEDEATFVTLAVPSDGQAGSVIGRNGSTIAALRSQMQVGIKVAGKLPGSSSQEEMPAGLEEGMEFITVQGSSLTITPAILSIARKLSDFQDNTARNGRLDISPKRSQGHRIIQKGQSSPQATSGDSPPAKRIRTVAPKPQECEQLKYVLLAPEQKEVVMGHGGSNLEKLRQTLSWCYLRLHDERRADGMRRLEIGCRSTDESELISARVFIDNLLQAANRAKLGPLQDARF